ncbi:coiled-coil domain-containing protein [Gemella sp. Musashino-2025]
MTQDEKDKLTDQEENSSKIDPDDNTNISFFGRLKSQLGNFKKNKTENSNLEEDHPEQKFSPFQIKKEIKQKEQEARAKAEKLEYERKQFEAAQKKAEEEREKHHLERMEQERIEKERIAREKELERQRIAKEQAEKREKERIEKERIAREKELERERIEKEKAEKREKERIEKERIAREKELERQRIEKEKAEKREKERIEKERIAREKELERQRIAKEQAEKRKQEFFEKEQAFKLEGDKKQVEFLEKENKIKEAENQILMLKTDAIVLDDKIAEEKRAIDSLKINNDDKEKITYHEKKLANFTFEKQKLEKEISLITKSIEKIKKNLELEHKLVGLKKEIYNIKKEVVNENETAFKIKDYDNKVKNIFLVAFASIKAFILKNIFRKNVENYDKIRKISKNIKIKIAISFILAIVLSIFFLILLKFVSSAKEHYADFDNVQTPAVDSTEEMKKQKEAEEKAKILEAQEKANAARIDSAAQDEEITAKLGGTFVSYSFDVNREITVNKKIHTFNSANWNDVDKVVESGTKFTVNKLVSPAGYMMYQITSGDHAGKFITANEKFVTIDKKNDDTSNFISKTSAIKFLATQNVYSDEEISKVKATFGSNAVLNISGYGISKNNRLVYHITDGSFIPVNPVRLIEVTRESAKSKNIDKDNNNSSNNQKNSTTQNTTRSKKNNR